MKWFDLFGIDPNFTCELTDCGQIRCGTCDERLMCTGPEPAVNACPDHADECRSCNDDNPCRMCRMVRRTARMWDDATEPPALTTTEIAAADHAERRREDDAHELAHLEDREEMNR